MPVKKKTTTPSRKKKAPKKRAATRRLNPRQKKFADRFVENGGNARQAALDAGYSQSTASVDVYRSILENPRIRERIADRVAEASLLTDTEVVGTLASHLRGDPTDAFDDSSPLINRLRQQKLGHLIRSITVKRYFEGHGEEATPVEVTRMEFHSSQSAAIQLCKVLGIEKQPEENPANRRYDLIAIEMEAAAERGEEITREEAARRVKADTDNFIRLAKKTGQDVQSSDLVQ